MKAKFVNESLNEHVPEDLYNEFSEEGLDVVDEPPFDQAEITDDDDFEGGNEDVYVQDEFETALNNELKIPEYARKPISFRLKGQPGIIDAVPMAKMKDGSFLMKVGDRFRKFRMSDIIEESLKR
jgi:hypothetical protein